MFWVKFVCGWHFVCESLNNCRKAVKLSCSIKITLINDFYALETFSALSTDSFMFEFYFWAIDSTHRQNLSFFLLFFFLLLKHTRFAFRTPKKFKSTFRKFGTEIWKKICFHSKLCENRFFFQEIKEEIFVPIFNEKEKLNFKLISY